MSNPDVPGPYWQDPAGADRGSAAHGRNGHGGGRERGRQDGYQSNGSGRRPGRDSAAAAPAAGPRGGDDPWDQQRGRRARGGPGADPAGGRGDPGARGARNGAPAGGRAPQGQRGGRGYRPDQEAGGGRVAQDLRARLGVRPAGGPDGAGRNGTSQWDERGASGGPRGQRGAAGYAGDGYGRTAQRGRPGTADDPWRGRGADPRGPGRGRRGTGNGNGNGGPGGRGGGPGGRGGGRRSLKEWFLSGTWWRRWTWKKALIVAASAGIGVCVLAAGGFLWAYSHTKIPTATTFDANAQPSQVYYSNGSWMAKFSNSSAGNREVLTTKQIPPVMDNAMIAAEDRSFESEGGISLTGILRAAYEDLKGGGYAQGGSTLTEELVKNYYAGFATANNTDKAAGDKLKEILVSIKLAHTESKATILTEYLNTVPFGEQAYGVGAASETYFGKPAKDLDVAQAAMLAALPNAPGYFSTDPSDGEAYQALVARYQYVLTNMVRDGALSPAKAARLKAHFPKVHLHLGSGLSGYRGYLMQMVGQELAKTYGLTQTQLDTGGYKITTTFSPSLTKGLYSVIAQEKAQMKDMGQALPSYAHIGAVLEQPSNGAILAVYGGPGYTSNDKKCLREDCYYNMAEDPKQVGSSFKPYILADAVSQGMDVQDSVLNGFSPIWIPEGQTQVDDLMLSSRTAPTGAMTSQQGYLEFNEADENSDKGLSVINAAAISSDPAFMDLAHRDGVQHVINMAGLMGVGQTPFTEGNVNDLTNLNDQFGASSKLDTAGSVAIALGEGDLTAVEQTSLFATLADDGIYHAPHVIAQIMQGSRQISLKVATRQVLTASAAADADYALSADNVPGGTAYPDAAWPGRQVIGKTGTTQTAQDAWFLGAVPQYSMGVAMFTNQQDSSTGAGAQTLDLLPDLPGNATGGYGGAWPAKIWGTFMLQQLGSTPVAPLPTQDYAGFVKWDQVTGLAPTTPSPAPAPTTAAPGPTCTPSPGHACFPGGTTPPTISTSPPTPSYSPTPSCPPFRRPCTQTTPPTQQNAIGLTGPAAAQEKSSGPTLLGAAVAVLLGSF